MKNETGEQSDSIPTINELEQYERRVDLNSNGANVHQTKATLALLKSIFEKAKIKGWSHVGETGVGNFDTSDVPQDCLEDGELKPVTILQEYRSAEKYLNLLLK